MRILYAVGSWGLGHATRNLPVMQALLAAGADLTVVSHGRALILLRRELVGRCEFLDWPDVPATIARNAVAFYAKSALALPQMVRTMLDERGRTAALLHTRRFDRIVSDNRYGVQHPGVPSFHIAHSLRFIAPRRWALIERMLEGFNFRWFAGLRKVIVPDTIEDALSGDLAHRLRFFPPSLLAYVGILSRIGARSVPQDLDIFITLSGPEPQRTLLERVVRGQIASAGGRIVVALGKPDVSAVERMNGCEIHGYLDQAAQEEMMNRARIVVARAGYSTIMELAELERRAVLIPTPGQTEQVYLAAYHDARGTIRAVDQRALSLARDVALAANRPGLRARVKTADAVRGIVDLVLTG